MRLFILAFLFLAACSQTPLKQNGHPAKALEPANREYISTLPSRGIDFGATLNRVAFGSCADQDQPQPLWKTILADKPDLFVMNGEGVYASSPQQQPIAEQYRKADLVPEYRAIREKIPFMATWDDHDYGKRDGGADWVGKNNAKRDFINFYPYVKNSIPFEQGGIYHAKIIGPKKKMVQIIMLDTRYYRTPLHDKFNDEGKLIGYNPSDAPTDTILGAAQWEWLETQLRRPADVRLIFSSIQVIADDPTFEKWGNYPLERQKLFDLIKATHAKNVILVSGDRHVASIAKVDLKNHGALYEITASSINKAKDVTDADSHYIGAPYNRENFGVAAINWAQRTVNLEVHDMDNKVVNSVEVKLRK